MAIYWPSPGFKRRTFKLCVKRERERESVCVWERERKKNRQTERDRDWQRNKDKQRQRDREKEPQQALISRNRRPSNAFSKSNLVRMVTVKKCLYYKVKERIHTGGITKPMSVSTVVSWARHAFWKNGAQLDDQVPRKCYYRLAHNYISMYEVLLQRYEGDFSSAKSYFVFFYLES